MSLNENHVLLSVSLSNRRRTLGWGHQVLFYLWQIGPVLKHCKVLKYYGQDCRITMIVFNCYLDREMYKVLKFLTNNSSFLEISASPKSSHKNCSMQKGIPRNFTKFTGKHLCQSLFFNEVAGLRRGLQHY